MDPADVAALVCDDLAALRDIRVFDHVSALLLTPPQPVRVWVARHAGEVYEGFVVLTHPSSDTSIVYCTGEYYSANPWGLVFTPRGSPTPQTWCYGDWYSRFLLRVLRVQGSARTGHLARPRTKAGAGACLVVGRVAVG